MAQHETVIALDFGLRHIGVAVGNTLSQTAEPLAVIKAKDGTPDWSALEAIIKEWQPQRIIVGHPINMDGTDSDLSQRAAAFSRKVTGRLGLPVVLVDERLSSREAKANARAEGHRGDFAADPIDDQAAAIILSTWLHEQ